MQFVLVPKNLREGELQPEKTLLLFSQQVVPLFHKGMKLTEREREHRALMIFTDIIVTINFKTRTSKQ